MKNKMMRLASLLMVAVLLTTSVVSGTYAKYVTRAEGGDSARVAKWGIVLTTSSDLFKTSYDGINGVSVLSGVAEEDVIAPGTTGTAAIFTIQGAPEVDTQLDVSLGEFKRVTLPNGTYKDYTTADTTDTFYVSPAEGYRPVLWTLERNGTEVVTKQGLDKVEEYLHNTLTGLYEVEGGTGKKVFYADAVGTYTLTWEWPFYVSDDNDKADTYLGQIAAGVEEAPATGYEPKEIFALTITATQVD